MPFPRRPALPAAGVVAASAAALLFSAGCGGDTATQKGGGSASKQQQTDPWPEAVAELRKDADPAACRRVLSRLGADLSANPDAEQLTGLSPDAEKSLREVFPLTDDDLAEVRPAGFTPLDGAYLADCLYLHDAAAAAASPDPAPARRAEAAFAWVCRQVELRPWALPVPNQQALFAPPLPATAVLRRGSGGGLERAYVFLALLQQYGIDGCLVGGPKSGDQPSILPFAPNSPGVPKGPFWAVGARVGADVLLFDPWRGEPLPGPGGNGVATLAQVTADPGTLKGWDVKPEVVKEATAYLAVPLSAAAPRIALLEKKLTAGDRPVRLAVDPVGLRARFAAEAKLPGVKVWNPAGDPFTVARGLGTFLPVSEGGKDAGKEGQRLKDLYQRELLPPSVFVVPEGLTAREVIDRLFQGATGRLAAAFLTTPTARERIQRGLYYEVSPVLVKQRDGFAAARDRGRTDRSREESVRQWVKEVQAASAAVGRARLNERQSPGSVAEAQAAVERLWLFPNPKDNPPTAIVDAAVAEYGLAEATYLLALCKHEQAEAAEARADAAKFGDDAAVRTRDQAKEAWSDAQNWWSQYAPLAASQEQGYPGRTKHAARLAERATRLAGPAAR